MWSVSVNSAATLRLTAGRLFYGGLTIAQALLAASRTVGEHCCHSIHALFLRPGDPGMPILYEVSDIKDGRSYSRREVVAIQDGQQILRVLASFHLPETGPEHQEPMPAAAEPETLISEREIALELIKKVPTAYPEFLSKVWPMEIRPLDPPYPHHKVPADFRAWFRVPHLTTSELAAHQCLLAYMSDFALLDTSLRPHGHSILHPGVQLASLDHAMWFHRPFRADDWLLFCKTSPSAHGGRGFGRGVVYDRDGRFIASMAQEGVMRVERDSTSQ